LHKALQILVRVQGGVVSIDLKMPYKTIHKSLEKPRDFFEAVFCDCILSPILWVGCGFLRDAKDRNPPDIFQAGTEDMENQPINIGN